MKKVTKLVVMSVLTVALCVSLIAGATFALFTSEANVDIVVSSGKVDVAASVQDLAIASTLPGEDNLYHALGSAAIGADGTLNITDMVPGDYVTFQVVIENRSTVATKWQLSLSRKDAADKALFDLLTIEITGIDGLGLVKTSTGTKSEWQTLAAATEGAQTVGTLDVKISMPESVVDQDAGDCAIAITVAAVQGNAHTDNPVAGAINLSEALDVDELQTADEIVDQIYLLNDIELPAGDVWKALDIASSVTFHGNGHTISFAEGDPEQFVAEAGATISNVTLRLAQDFGKRCTWNDAGETDVAWQVNNDNGLATLANNVNEGVKTISAHSLIATIAEPVPQTYEGQVIELTQDVDLAGKEWTPIGTVTPSHLFKGTFDGKGHTIRNLTYTTATSGAGLFNSTGNALFRNINLENITISGTEYIGALVGYGYTSDFENITATNIKLTGNHYIGGIGGGSYSTFVNCHVEHLEIVCTPDGEPDSYDNGDKVGGLTGIQESGSFKMDNCSVIDAHITAFRDVGGFVGYANNGHVTNSVLEDVHITIDRTKNYSENDPKEINADSYIGRKGTACTVDEVSAAAVKNFTIDYVNCGMIPTADGYGIYGTEGLVQLRNSVNNGKNYAGVTISLYSDITLSDSSWVAIGDTSEHSFCGTFDGRGHSVTYTINLVAPQPGHYGLFGVVNGHVEIRNLVVKGSVTMSGAGNDKKLSGGNILRIGGIVAGTGIQPVVTFKNCISAVDFDFSDLITHSGANGYKMYFGGILGDAGNCTFENLVFAGHVSLNESKYVEGGKEYLTQWAQADSCIGGIAGVLNANDKLTNCLNVGQAYLNTAGYGAAAGGLVGKICSPEYFPEVTDCFSLKVRTLGMIGYDPAGTNDALESLTVDNWESQCAALKAAGWTWSEEFGCPVPAM